MPPDVCRPGPPSPSPGCHSGGREAAEAVPPAACATQQAVAVVPGFGLIARATSWSATSLHKRRASWNLRPDVPLAKDRSTVMRKAWSGSCSVLALYAQQLVDCRRDGCLVFALR